jgi:hypothetical protein
MNTPRVRANLLASAIVAVGALLYRFPPERYSFYPRCPISRWTHWRCPGCGATRAIAALLHGRVAEALHDNPLFVILAPLLFAYFVVTYYGVMRNGRLIWPQVSPAMIRCLLVLATLFTLARNAYPL